MNAIDRFLFTATFGVFGLLFENRLKHRFKGNQIILHHILAIKAKCAILFPVFLLVALCTRVFFSSSRFHHCLWIITVHGVS